MSIKQLREVFEKEHPVPSGVIFSEPLNHYTNTWGGSPTVLRNYEAMWRKWKQAETIKQQALIKVEEKMLGPHEQAESGNPLLAFGVAKGACGSDKAEQCPLCEAYQVVDLRIKHCLDCDSEFAGAEETEHNKQAVIAARKFMSKVSVERDLLAQHIAEIDAWNASMEKIVGKPANYRWESLEALRKLLTEKPDATQRPTN